MEQVKFWSVMLAVIAVMVAFLVIELYGCAMAARGA